MTAPRFARRLDGNHNALVAVFERLGCSVLDLTKTGVAGCPDVLVGCQGIDHKVEFKDPSQAYGRKGLSAVQSEFSRLWRGESVYTVDSEDGVIALVNQWRKPKTVTVGGHALELLR